MRQSILLIVLSGLLSMSILAPSVCTLLDVTIAYTSVNESQDDEPLKKGEIELEEKQWVTQSIFGGQELAIAKKARTNAFYTASNSLLSLEIFLPPPEQQL